MKLGIFTLFLFTFFNNFFLFDLFRIEGNANNLFIFKNNNNNFNQLQNFIPQNNHKFSNQNSQQNSNGNNLLSHIVEIFQISQHDLQFLQANFELKNLELIYPKGLEQLKQMKRCVLGAQFKRSSKMAAIKLEFDNSVRAKYDQTTKLINCNAQNIRGEPTEKYIANLMQNRTYFIKFYNDFSKQFVNGGKKINIYVYERLPKSENLLQTTERMRASNVQNLALEKLFRKHFSKIHTALSQLQHEGYTYTDFKPENVLIDTVNDRSYLIDLESVVNNKSKFVCLRTLSYTPPLYYKDGRFIDADGLSSRAFNEFFNGQSLISPHDRILSWTFCFSIYSLICTNGNEIHSKNFQNKYMHWASENFPFITYFGCPTGQVSKSLVDLINNCLVKQPKKLIFPRLIKHPWLSNQ